VLEAERGETKNEAKLDELLGYLQARQVWMVNERQRRIERKYIGSAQVEKANDLIVYWRQKKRGMQWSEATSDGLRRDPVRGRARAITACKLAAWGL
jgi:hypothetical protein